MKQGLFVGTLIVTIAACSFLQRKIGDQISDFVGRGSAQYFECEEPPKVIKWFQEKCASVGACTVPTGPISGAILKPIVDKLVPEAVDFVIPDAWGVCKGTKPKEGLKAFLYTLIDALPVELPN